MQRWIIPATILASLAWAAVVSAQAHKGEVRSFELNPVAPPIPALKYKLLTDPLDRRPGDGVVFYMRAALLDSTELNDQVDKAMDARDVEDDEQFKSLASEVFDVSNNSIAPLLKMGGEREGCDWNPGIDEQGVFALLPELNNLREVANLLGVRASYQMRQGHIDDALATLRTNFEFGQKIGQSPVLVSALVAEGIHAIANDRLAELMTRPDSPNLYWALASLPRPLLPIRRSIEGGSVELPAMIPELAKARSQELSPQQWRDIMNRLVQIHNQLPHEGNNVNNKLPDEPSFDEQMKDGGAGAKVLPAARQHYAQTRKLPPAKVADQDPAKIVAIYYYDQYREISDDICKTLEMPYPQMIASLDTADKKLKQMKQETPGNPLLEHVPPAAKAVMAFVRVDRTIAALTAVEAIRSYAAAHDGKLPTRLQDLTDTPVPLNPRSGQAFEYRVEKDSATLSDPQLVSYPLSYTISIRK